MTHPQSSLDELLAYLHRSRGIDFGGYKASTLERRIQKRMTSVNAHHYGAYMAYLEAHPEEVPELFNSILINVTSFFRDADAWAHLQNETIPNLLAARQPGASIRVWSAGCASGEEPFTIAMIFAEILGIEEASRRVKIYATDRNEEALRHARLATFGGRELRGLTPPLLDKYFTTDGSSCVLRKELRRMTIFGRHDLTKNAPISRIDLLTCRNTMMYLDAETQERVAQRLHFALTDGGTLMLGKAEMLLSHADLFTPIDLNLRIFNKIPSEPDPTRTQRPVAFREDSGGSWRLDSLRQAAFESAPIAHLVIDWNGALSFANQRAKELFALVPRDLGRPMTELELSYRPLELSGLLEQAYGERRHIVVKDVPLSQPGLAETRAFDVTIAPLASDDGTLIGAQITFLEVTLASDLARKLARTQRELDAAYESLQSTSEQLETTNEELRSTVEQLGATNDELQSANEELATIHDELRTLK